MVRISNGFVNPKTYVRKGTLSIFYKISIPEGRDRCEVNWMRSQLSNILDSFTLSTGKLALNSDQTSELVESHQRNKEWNKSTLVRQLSLIASVLTEFASSQLLFCSLSKEDQIILLKNNIPLYLQYVVARYVYIVSLRRKYITL
jgi:hypothetical protein